MPEERPMKCDYCKHSHFEVVSLGMIDTICELFEPHSVESHRGYSNFVPSNCPALNR